MVNKIEQHKEKLPNNSNSANWAQTIYFKPKVKIVKYSDFLVLIAFDWNFFQILKLKKNNNLTISWCWWYT